MRALAAVPVPAGRLVTLPPRPPEVGRLVLFVQQPDGGPVHAALEVPLP